MAPAIALSSVSFSPYTHCPFFLISVSNFSTKFIFDFQLNSLSANTAHHYQGRDIHGLWARNWREKQDINQQKAQVEFDVRNNLVKTEGEEEGQFRFRPPLLTAQPTISHELLPDKDSLATVSTAVSSQKVNSQDQQSGHYLSQKNMAGNAKY